MGPDFKPPSLVGVLLFFLFLTACSSGLPVQTEPGKRESGNNEIERIQVEKGSNNDFDNIDEGGISGGRFVQTGVASWYGDGFHGRRTANGEVYDMHRLTAAHNSLPFNSIVEVENLENHRKTIVRINDRGPFVKNRVIDLSLKAATFLGMDEKGTARVRIRLIKPPEIARGPSREAGYCIQAGAFVHRMNAYNLMLQLNEIVKETKFEIELKNGYHKVVSGRVTGWEAAAGIERKLESYGFEVIIMRFDFQ